MQEACFGRFLCFLFFSHFSLKGDHQSRKLLNSLLLDPPTSKERQEAIALYLSGKETADVFPGFKVEEEDRQVDFIQNVDQREKRFKELVAGIYAGAEDLAKLDSPLSGKNYEYFFVVAVVTGKIFTFSTPALKPIVGSEHGRKLISTLLETTLKQLAEEGDPEAARRELAAIERAKAKEQAEKE